MASSDWREISVEHELSAEQRKLYDEMKAQYRVYAGAKALFESSMQLAYGNSLAEDEELKFGYNFGKLSVAIGEKRERKPKREAKPTQSFADWLKGQRAEGRNC